MQVQNKQSTSKIANTKKKIILRQSAYAKNKMTMTSKNLNTNVSTCSERLSNQKQQTV